MIVTGSRSARAGARDGSQRLGGAGAQPLVALQRADQREVRGLLVARVAGDPQQVGARAQRVDRGLRRAAARHRGHRVQVAGHRHAPEPDAPPQQVVGLRRRSVAGVTPSHAAYTASLIWMTGASRGDGGERAHVGGPQLVQREARPSPARTAGPATRRPRPGSCDGGARQPGRAVRPHRGGHPPGVSAGSGLKPVLAAGPTSAARSATGASVSSIPSGRSACAARVAWAAATRASSCSGSGGRRQRRQRGQVAARLRRSRRPEGRGRRRRRPRGSLARARAPAPAAAALCASITTAPHGRSLEPSRPRDRIPTSRRTRRRTAGRPPARPTAAARARTSRPGRSPAPSPADSSLRTPNSTSADDERDEGRSPHRLPCTVRMHGTVVMKFGGTSVADAERIRRAARAHRRQARGGPARRRGAQRARQDDRRAHRLGAGDLPAPGPARDGHAPVDRRAPVVRAVRHGDQRPRPPCHLPHRITGRDRDRHVAHEGAHPRGTRRPHPRGRSTTTRSSSSPASRACRPPTT